MPDEVRPLLQKLLLDGPNGAIFRHGNITVTGINALKCEAAGSDDRCSFSFALSTGEVQPTTLTFTRGEGHLWHIAGR